MEEDSTLADDLAFHCFHEKFCQNQTESFLQPSNPYLRLGLVYIGETFGRPPRCADP